MGEATSSRRRADFCNASKEPALIFPGIITIRCLAVTGGGSIGNAAD